MKKKDENYKEILDNLADGVYFVDRDAVLPIGIKAPKRITGLLPIRCRVIFARIISLIM